MSPPDPLDMIEHDIASAHSDALRLAERYSQELLRLAAMLRDKQENANFNTCGVTQGIEQLDIALAKMKTLRDVRDFLRSVSK